MDQENAKGLMTEVFRKFKAEMESTDDAKPTFFVGNEEGVGIIPAMWQTDHQKDMYSQIVRKICEKIGATYVLFISETWIVRDKAAEDFQKNRDKYPDVQSHPMSQEVVSLFYESVDGLNLWANVPITRKEDGKPVLGELKIEQGMLTEGRFADFLGKGKKVPEGATIH